MRRFLLASVVFLMFVFTVKGEETTENLILKKVEKGKVVWLLKMKKSIEKEGFLSLEGIEGRIGEKELYFEAENGLYDKGRGIIQLRGKVKGKAGKVEWESPLMVWEKGEKKIFFPQGLILKEKNWRLKGEKGEWEIEKQVLKMEGEVRWERY